MKVDYSPSVTQSPDYVRIQEATSQMEEVLRKSPFARNVIIEWDRSEDDRQRATYHLRLKDPVGQAETVFSPEDLKNLNLFGFRLPRVWGDLLQIHSDRQHAKVEALVKQYITEEKSL